MRPIEELLHTFDQLRTSDGYIKAAFPGYNRIFGRDSLIVALQLLDKEPEIAQKVLLLFSKLQAKKIDNKADAEPGKILHEDSEDPKQKGIYKWKWPYYGSIDSTPLYLILAEKYLLKTGDLETIHTIWKNLHAAYEWIYLYGDLDGDTFVEYQRRNPYGLYHQGWKDSIFDSLKITTPVALVEVQGYAYAAYQAYASIASKLNKPSDNSTLAYRKAALLKEKFHQAFWLEREKYYAFALDGEKKKVKQITSNPGHLIFTGILNADQTNFVIKKLFSKELFTPYGIRTLSEFDPNFHGSSYHRGSIWPHDNWMIYYGLKYFGYKKYANRLKISLLKAYNNLHNLPELYLVDHVSPNKYNIKLINNIVDLSYSPNTLQAWSLGALISMLYEE